MEFTLLWSALAGVAALYASLWWVGRRDPDLCVRDLWEIAIAAGVVGLGVGRLVAMMRGGVNPLAHPGDLLLVRAGVDTVGATVAALATSAWLARADLREQLDGLAPAALAGLAGWHAGCVFRDACLGTPSSLPWAWAQPGSDITRHPVEVYAAVLLAMASWALFRLRRHDPAAGVVAALALAGAGAVRLLTEPMRPSLFAAPVWWYAAALVGGLALAWWTAIRPAATDTTDEVPPLQ